MPNQLIVHGELSQDAEFIVTVVGVVDPTTTDEMLERCRALGQRIDVFDLRFVSLISAAGVSALSSLISDARCRVIASDIVLRVLSVCALGDSVEVGPPDGRPSLDRASFGVAVHDSSLRFLYVNDAMASINGVPVQAHVGRRPRELFDIDPSRDDVTPLLFEVLTTGQGRDVEVVGRTAGSIDGRWLCRYRRGRYDTGTSVENVALATVQSIVESGATPRRDLALAS